MKLVTSLPLFFLFFLMNISVSGNLTKLPSINIASNISQEQAKNMLLEDAFNPSDIFKENRPSLSECTIADYYYMKLVSTGRDPKSVSFQLNNTHHVNPHFNNIAAVFNHITTSKKHPNLDDIAFTEEEEGEDKPIDLNNLIVKKCTKCTWPLLYAQENNHHYCINGDCD